MTDTRPVVVCDIDGTLTRQELSFLRGHRRLGDAVWKFLVATRLAERLLRRALPDPDALALLREFHEAGWYIRLVTAREARFMHLTVEWLREHDVPYGDLCMRPPWLDAVEHKVSCLTVIPRVSSRLPCLYLEDQLEIAEAVQERLGEPAPLIFHVTSWRLLRPVLRRLMKELS